MCNLFFILIAETSYVFFRSLEDVNLHKVCQLEREGILVGIGNREKRSMHIKVKDTLHSLVVIYLYGCAILRHNKYDTPG